MSVLSPGIARAVYEYDSTSWTFTALAAGTSVGTHQISGKWSIHASNKNKVFWDNDNPQITNNSGSQKTVDGLSISENTPKSYPDEPTPASLIVGLFAAATHDNVVLEDGDTIVYTSIEITFNTEDL